MFITNLEPIKEGEWMIGEEKGLEKLLTKIVLANMKALVQAMKSSADVAIMEVRGKPHLSIAFGLDDSYPLFSINLSLGEIAKLQREYEKGERDAAKDGRDCQ